MHVCLKAFQYHIWNVQLHVSSFDRENCSILYIKLSRFLHGYIVREVDRKLVVKCDVSNVQICNLPIVANYEITNPYKATLLAIIPLNILTQKQINLTTLLFYETSKYFQSILARNKQLKCIANFS